MAQVAYKILTAEQWTDFQATGRFEGAPVDLADGYIHMSAAHQVTETAVKHFAGQQGLILATVDLAVLGDAIRWEPSRGGQLFPHLYGTLPLDAVTETKPLVLAPDGNQVSPAL